MGDTTFNLERFEEAQTEAFHQAISELRAGRKSGHWMWFTFPQLRGLGRSEAAMFYGIHSIDEAQAYLGHPVLGPRLRQMTEAAIAAPAASLHSLFGFPDDMKFCSSMTLFSIASPDPRNVFTQALERWCNGKRDAETCRLLESERPG
ncbi:MAG: DUF1810 domain-containing protein [Rhodobiaceae bacterium]|nr:DUF1810 domain-containing protein [Rhodobiaceae bacterium]